MLHESEHQHTKQKNFKVLREPEVFALTGLSKTTRWRLERDGKFPQKRKLSAKAVGWLATEIVEWIQARTVISSKVEGVNNEIK